MPNKRDLRLDKYNISKYAYRELSNFCLQYPDKIKRLSDLRNPLKAQQYSDMPHGSGVGTPTEQAALIAAQLSRDTEMIKQTAIECARELYPWLIDGVTGVSYYSMNRNEYPIGRIPIGINKYNTIRRQFYYLLAKKKGIII